jgi:predicted phage tail protein
LPALLLAALGAAIPWRVATQPGVPSAPENLSATVTERRTVILSWTPGGGAVAAGYQVEASLVSAGPAIAALPVAATSLTVANVPEGTYFVRVRALSAAGASGPSNEVTVHVGTPPCGLPDAPANFSHTVTLGRVSLTWTPASTGCAPTHYVLAAGSATGLSDLARVNVGTATTFLTPAPAGIYFTRVYAVNGAGTSGPSNEEIISVGPSCTVPGAPDSFTATALGTTAAFAWQPPLTGGLPTGYQLEAGSTPDANNIAVLPLGGLSFSTPAPAGSYYVRVRAINACGPGPASTTQLLTIVCQPPGSAGTPSPTVSGSTVTLQWAGVAGAVQYRVDVGTAAGASNVAQRMVAGTNVQISGLAAGMYFTRVTALNACGSGPTSGDAIFTVAQSPGSRTCGGASVPGSAPCGVPSARCNDGTWSCSQNRSGTCSSHRGVSCWVCPGPLC